jgi:hypothetical protein
MTKQSPRAFQYGTRGVSEAAGTIYENFVLTITGTTTGTLALETAANFEYYTVPLGTITEGVDYQDLSAGVSYSYPAGSANGTIVQGHVDIYDDNVDEAQYEYFDFRTRYAGGAETAQLTIRISDNDTAGVTVTESGGSTTVAEGGATDTFTVRLASQPATGYVTIQLDPDTQCQLNGNTAGAPIVLFFSAANWNSYQSVVVSAVDDTINEGTHSCFIDNTLSASDSSEYPTTMTVADVTATIIDNDAPTSTPTATATRTNTPTNTATATRTPTNTNTFTPTSTNTLTPTNTATNTSTFTPTATRTNTPTNTATPTVTNTSTPLPVCSNVSLSSAVVFDTSSGVWFIINNANPLSGLLTDAKIVWKIPLPPNDQLLLNQGQINGSAWYINQFLSDVNGVTLNSGVAGWQNGTPPDYVNRKIAASGSTIVKIFYLNGTSNLGTVMSAYDFAGTTFTIDLGGGVICPLTLNLPTPTPRNTATFTPSVTNTATNTATFTPSYTNTPTDTATFTPTFTNTPIPPRPDTIGVYKNGTFYLRNSNTSGGADLTVPFGGDASDLPVVGDWNKDGVDTVGVYRSSTGFFYLSNSNTAPNADYVILFGNPGDAPFAGYWTSDMTGDGIGVYRNSNGILYQRKSLTSGFDDFFAVFGNPGDQAYAGNWESNGFDSIGIYRSSTQTWYMTNNSQPSGITFSDLSFVWDISTMLPVAGDWDGDHATNVGYLTPSGVFVLHASNGSSSTNDMLLVFGPTNGRPVAGKWIAPSRPPVVGIVGGSQPGSNNLGNNGGNDNAD